MNTESIKLAFIKQFNHEPIIVKAPGRINIIGEHTDYNDGYVMPAAINKAIYAAVSRRSDNEIHLYAESYSESVQTTICNLIKSEKSWANYILGVADQLQKWGYNIGGFNLYIDGDVPLGAGLSSSAAVECATAYALIELFSLSVPKLDIAKIAQKAEQTFAGVNCGIMDQFTSVFGKKNHALLLDCKSMKHEYIPLKLDGYTLVLLNTNVKHALVDSAYNRRRQQCEQGVAWVKAKVSKVNTLRDVDLKMLDKYVKPKDIDVYQKCRFVIEENDRVLQAAEQLKNGDLKNLGLAMFQTHYGLSRAYRVSCEELDFLVDSVKKLPYVLGARMMGGGFGGCTLNIVATKKVEEFIEKLQKAYQKEFLIKLDAYEVETGDGTKLIL
ncbi:galactokinase [Pedobacter sp. LMG 31464]|uniref:Galactokinase n=1 Tax=Pedobacter planticolens TaxID=2679964 RepID=A0A923IUH1_9SPHI|nr:galactokinase [Pedobacter planticolens]MBB2144886.1 galactokinase [Pedobacter planticolens]